MPARMPSGNTTLTEVLRALAADGYTTELVPEEPASLRCRACGDAFPAAEVETVRQERLEGASDPGDEAVVYGLTCPGCGARGTTVLRYGPEAGPVDAAVLLAIDEAPAGGA